jgi:hypothetical protein
VPLFYRLTYHDTPDPDDFRSQAELGKGRPRDISPEDWDSVSILDSAESAAGLRQRVQDAAGRNLGDFIATLDIPAAVEVRQQGSDPHHYLVRRPAEELVGYVNHIAAVIPLEPMESPEEPE